MSDTFIVVGARAIKRGFVEHYEIINPNVLSRFGFWVIVFFTLVAIFAPLIAPYDPWEMTYDSDGNFAALRPPSLEFPLGTTHLGYDLFSQLILATKVPQKPKNKLEKIICDADLDYLGREDFDNISDKKSTIEFL